MAACCHCVKLVFLCVPLVMQSNLYVGGTSEKKQNPGDDLFSSGTVQFNNPGLLKKFESGTEDDLSMFDLSEEKADPRRIGGIVIQDEARRLAFKLRELSNNEMGVPNMQAIYDSLFYEEAKPDLEKEVKRLHDQLLAKFNKGYLRLLATNKMQVETLYRSHLKSPLLARRDCCTIANAELGWDQQYSTYVSPQATCDLIPPSTPPDAFNPGRNLTEVFQHNVQYIPSVKWQYFISTEGIHNEFPSHNFRNMPSIDCRNAHDRRHRAVYVSTVQPQKKNVVIMVDHGNSLSANQLTTAKAIAENILLSLSERDRVGVIGLSSHTVCARDDGCVSNKLVTLTDEAKQYFHNFIKKMKKQTTPTDHSGGFIKAFRMIYDTLVPNNNTQRAKINEESMIIYISRGLLSSLTDAKDILDNIAVENGLMDHKVIINTYAVIDDGKPIMYEKTFLKDLAEQNFGAFQVIPRHSGPVRKGQMVPVNSTRDLSSVVGNFYKAFNRTTPKTPVVSLPYKDELSKGLVVAVAWPCFYNNPQHKIEDRLIGIVGLDIHMGDVVEGITYYTQDKGTYAFIIHKHGYTIMHPSLDRPILRDSFPLYTDIIHFEAYPGFDKVRDLILRHDSGSHRLEVPRSLEKNLHPSGMHMYPHIYIRYIWRKVKIGAIDDSPFIVVIRQVEDSFKYRDIKDVHGSSVPQLVYHRLDLLPTDNTCMHLKQLATLDTSALFLAAQSFNSPFEHLSQIETKRMVQGYLAYLNDNTNLISNPVIKESIRKDVAAVSRINHEWLRQFRSSVLNDFVVRRYVSTPSGVFQIFPGTLLNKAYDPTKRNWYTRAMEFPGKVTLTAPYLDKGGAGYIVTISHTIYEGKHAALHGPFDRVVAVMGMDLTLGYFYKVLMEHMPICERDYIKCFIMDDRGYLIAHRSLIEPNGKGPLEQQHITHKEPLVANDILIRQGFVQKKLCNSYNDRTIQRFYHFNTSLTGVVTNLAHGEHCSKYQITPIPGTNAFLGIVNQTCDTMRAFCPCSMVDRLCLNCKRMEQHECECPCECHLEMDFCTGSLLEKEDENPSCRRYQEDVDLASVSSEVSKALPQCFHTHCTSRKTIKECLGVRDCEWCALDSDGMTPLTQPFCSTQRVCFAGVLGARTPYHDEIKAALLSEEPITLKSTPVGPVAGGIMGCFLVLALGVYCYRHHVHRSSHQYISSLPDGQGRMSHLDNEPDDPNDIEEPGTSGHTNNIVLATFDNPASISPYRVNTTYRRPTGGDSDHGYSTMTPHEDSEQASTTCIEPLIISRDRYRPSPHTVLTQGKPMLPPPPSSRRSRSPTPPQTRLPTHATIPEQIPLTETIIPESSPHSIIANVTVHMVDTH